MQDPIVQFPDTFDGRFYFTNTSEEDFMDKWNGVIYTFPARKTSPIIIPTATMEETQAIRKKFATTFAEREFYKSSKLKKMTPKVGEGESLQTALTYTESDLAPFIQACLEPLPIAVVKVEQAKPKRQYRLRVDNEGKPVTRIIKAAVSETGMISGEALAQGTPIEA